MTVLLDTTVLVDVLRGDPRARQFLATLTGVPSVSVVSVAELYRGARSRRQERDVDSLLRAVDVVPITMAVAKHAGLLQKHHAASHGLQLADALVAATAEAHGLALKTHNVKHFPMFAKLAAPY